MSRSTVERSSVELFSGAGGLALGLARAGWNHRCLIERDYNACQTLELNRGMIHPTGDEYDLITGDIQRVDYGELIESATMVAGGPPCQPFSLGGKHKGNFDNRDMFPEAVRAVQSVRPKVFVFENVKGLLRKNFSTYFEYVLLQLQYPEVSRPANCDWLGHLDMLEDVHTSQSEKGLKYNVIFRLLNAADYGIPQFRQRVFIIGFRSDLKVEWHFPKASHGIDALLHEQWVTGEYWDHHKVPLRGRPKINPRHVKRVEQIRVDGINPCGPKLRFLTTRDAIYGLPNPRRKNDQFNHDYRPGAKPYPGHTGSDLDLPSKTLKAGDHGVPGGENMINYRNGQYRYFTVRESARLQTFPDNYQFYGSWTEAMRQIGNAVPVELARIIGVSLKTELDRLNDKK